MIGIGAVPISSTPIEAEPIEAEPIETETVTVVDTTAELLGRAKPKKPRARVSSGSFGDGASSTPARSSRSKAGARKTSATRRRAKKETEA